MSSSSERVSGRSSRGPGKGNASPVLWAILAVAVACLGLSVYSHIMVRTSFAQAQADFNARFEVLKKNLDTFAGDKLPGVAKNVADLQNEAAALTTRTETAEKSMENRVAALQGSVNSAEQKSAALASSLDGANARIAAVESSYNSAAQQLAALKQLVPVGTILAYFGNTSSSAPTGWMPCDGRSTGLSSWTSVPDLRGRFLRGLESGAVLGNVGGRDSIPDHFHSVTGSSNDVTFGLDSVTLASITMFHPFIGMAPIDPNTFALAVQFNPNGRPVSHGHAGGTATFSGSTSKAGGFDNRPAFTSVNYICRVS